MGTIWGGTQQVSDYFSLAKANDRLAQENFELKVRIAQFEQIEADARETSYSAAKDIAGNYRYTPAEIIKISTGGGHNYFIIDKGSDDGIVEGSGVITGKGAVGIIDAVSRHFSYARSFQNFDMSISARLGKEGSAGPMSWRGKGGSKALLKDIPHHVEFSSCDTVYTSGYSSIFPPDIPLGAAGKAKIVNGATYEIDVTLFEDFGALRYVTVVENTGQNEINSLENR
jgi:rod shape-determining protein MreC